MSVEGSWHDGLNDAQRAAAEHAGGPLIVLAGPGTGKTRVIIARLRRLLDAGAEPESILALTFSVKAAEEMRTRLAEAVDPRLAERVGLATFHSFGRRVLARFGDMIALRPEPVVMDSVMRRGLMREALFEAAAGTTVLAPGVDAAVVRALAFVDASRSAGRSGRDALEFARGWRERLDAAAPMPRDDAALAEQWELERFEVLAAAFTRFEERSPVRGRLSFDDFLMLPLRLFKEQPGVAALLRSEIRHVVVDEFQDVNAAQIELLRHIAPRGADVCVVGDDDQAIYGFRGADPRAFERFDTIWPGARRIELVENYRSGTAVLSAAARIIERATTRVAPDKRVVPAGSVAPIESRVEGVIAPDAQHGAVIAAMIRAERRDAPDRPWRSFAVLARTQDFRDTLARAMRLSGIPVSVRVRTSPLEDPAVKDLLAWAGVMSGVDVAANLQRVLLRPPVSATSLQVSQWKGRHEVERERGGVLAWSEWLAAGSVEGQAARRFAGLFRALQGPCVAQAGDVALDAIARMPELIAARGPTEHERASRTAQVIHVLRYARSRQAYLEPPGDLAALLRYIDALDDQDRASLEPPGLERLDHLAEAASAGPSEDAVQVMTAHQCKGLEFQTVFVARVRPGHGFPQSRRANDIDVELPEAFSGQPDHDHADEERRLFYVACTRASRRLVLLANPRASITKAIDYFNELTLTGPEPRIPVAPGDTWLDRTPGAQVADHSGVGGERATGDQPVERAWTQSWSDAVATLTDAANSPADDEESDGASIEARAVAAIRRIRALAALRRGVSAAQAIRASGLAPALHGWLEGLSQSAAAEAPARAAEARPLDLSFTTIDQYRRCPRCYWLKYVLGYDEPKTAQLSVGDIVHVALKRFAEEWTGAESNARALPGADRLLRLGREAARARWPESQPLDPMVDPQVEAQLRQYAARLHDPHAQVQFIEQSFAFEHTTASGAPGDSPLTHQIRGKIDRVDLMPDNSYRLIDYKTGKVTAKLREPKADDLQMGLYAMALPRVLGLDDADRGALAGTAEYWLLSTGEKGRIALSELDLAKVRATIDAAIEGILCGRFGKGKDCSSDFCDLLDGAGLADAT